MIILKKYLLILLLAITAISCSTEPTDRQESRTFYMGTTPFPADITVAESDKAYQFIHNHCDIISHHINDGIPYEEFYSDLTLPTEFVNNINYRKYKTGTNIKVFLSVGALSNYRTTKDIYYPSSTVAEAIKTEWENLAFDDPKMVTAYVKYINWLINQFNPIYVNYGVESNSTDWNTSEFQQYKNFLTQVYFQLKTAHPNIPFFVSFMLDHTEEGLNNAQQLLSISDFMGLSAYPYGIDNINNTSNPDLIPSNFFERYIQLAPNKPLAFAETGYIAQDLTVSYWGINKHGTPEWQNQYLNKVLELAMTKKAGLFIWFCPKDYDAMMQTLIQQGTLDPFTLNLLLLWRDTGLIDENDITRPAYSTWLKYMNIPKE